MDDSDGNSVTTRLLTLLNVSATKAGKRKRTYEVEVETTFKPLKRKSISFALPGAQSPQVKNKAQPPPKTVVNEIDAGSNTVGPVNEQEETVEDLQATISKGYENHYGIGPQMLNEASREAVERGAWETTKTNRPTFGITVTCTPEGSHKGSVATEGTINILDRLLKPFRTIQMKQPKESVELQNNLLATLSLNRDMYITATPIDSKKYLRDALTLHALNHVTRKRRRILKNNERLAHAAKNDPNAPPPEDVQDQALNWVNSLITHTPTPEFQIENSTRFSAEYGLPAGTVDKLAVAEPGTYPPDHVETFKGNIDDNFRLGVKITRKSVKLFAEFYGCDIIFASPLGLRLSIEKEKSADFLSSIEMVVVDAMDAIAMQNWEHLEFVFANLNKLPKESHNTDFSRIKPWYLDGHSIYLRQSILLSAYETPETRALFNTALKNVEGKIRTETRWPPVNIPQGVDPNFTQFDSSSPVDEVEKRFHFFTTQLLPSVLKSAVQSANTAIFVPSSFDFIRVHNHFKKNVGVTFAVLSEYSSNQDISRARQAFFEGKKSFLLISERFHFFRRYKIRGIRNIIFYGPPDHPQFYTELLSCPFLDDGVEPSDVACRVLYSKYDWFRLERIAGTQGAMELIKGL